MTLDTLWRISQKSHNALGWTGLLEVTRCSEQGGHPAQNSANFKDRTNLEAASGCCVSYPRELQFSKDGGSSAFVVGNLALSEHPHGEKSYPITESKHLLRKCVSVPLPLHTS